MSIAEAGSSDRTAHPTITGEFVRGRAIGILVGAMVAGGLLGGCVTVPSTNEAGMQDCKIRITRVIDDRDALLAAARVEIAASKIAAAKKDAELQELRKAVGDLRRENADSHHALTVMKRTVDTAQEETDRLRTERAQAEQTKQERELSELRTTVHALTERMDRLKEQVLGAVLSPTALSEESSRPTSAAGKNHRPRPSKPMVLPIDERRTGQMLPISAQ